MTKVPRRWSSPGSGGDVNPDKNPTPQKKTPKNPGLGILLHNLPQIGGIYLWSCYLGYESIIWEAGMFSGKKMPGGRGVWVAQNDKLGWGMELHIPNATSSRKNQALMGVDNQHDSMTL